MNESIKVGVVFTEGNTPQPRWFVWQKRKYDVKEITYTWRWQDGESLYLRFSVTDGKNVFEISFNQKSLQWKLTGVQEGWQAC